MTIFEKIKQKILKSIGFQNLDSDPNSKRYQFINDDNTIKKQHLEEVRIWYVGDSDELLNFYTTRMAGENSKEPIYNRNKPNYYWAINSKGEEQPIKKVHSGIPRAIVDTISVAVGMPEISANGQITFVKEESKLSVTYELSDLVKKMLKKNNFTMKLTQEARPMTLVEGWGAWKPNFNKNISDYPTFQYYEGENVDYIVKSGSIIGIVYRDFYKYATKDYVLLETRYIDNGNSIIKFELYRLEKSNEIEQVELSTIPELENLKDQIIPGVKKIMGVPCKYFYDVMNKHYGRSIYTGKIDVFDDIDQCLSQASQTDRVSTPVEYYPSDVLERNGQGQTELPSVYNRQFIKNEAYPDGDGKLKGQIVTTQPVLNYSQYIERYKSLIDVAITGILSPASMGIDIAKKDNADAQREKEKVTIFTRNNIIDQETEQIKELISIGIMLKEYMETGKVTIQDYDITVKYSEFANPTFESMSKILLPMWAAGAISTEMYVDKLYGDSLSDEDKQKEIQKLEQNKQADNFGDMGDFGLGDNNNDGTGDKESDEQQAISKKATDLVA